MKKVLLASCIASLSAATSADVVLPNLGIDGWDTDLQFYRGQAFSQGYLTASGVKNHTINPAFALEIMESAEARMDVNGIFSGGAFSQLFGQNVGLYLNRPTYDGSMYMVDTNADGALDSDLGFDTNSDGAVDQIFSAPNNILDAYWAANAGLGQVGVRLNYRANSYEENLQVNVDNIDETLSGSLKEVNTTFGLVSNSLPLEATFTVGLPFGELSYVNKNDNTNSKDEYTGEIDKGLRWGATTKYTLSKSASDTSLVSAFIGASAANYNASDKDVDTSTGDSTPNYDVTHIYERSTFGVVASHQKVVNSRTRLVASAGLTRYATKVGNENNMASPSAPAYVESVTYRVPIAIGVEFRKSEKTELIGSVSGDLFNRDSDGTYANIAGDSEETSNETDTWYSNNASVEFGFSYELAPRLKTNFVVNKTLFNSGLDEGLSTIAEFNYEF